MGPREVLSAAETLAAGAARFIREEWKGAGAVELGRFRCAAAAQLPLEALAAETKYCLLRRGVEVVESRNLILCLADPASYRNGARFALPPLRLKAPDLLLNCSVEEEADRGGIVLMTIVTMRLISLSGQKALWQDRCIFRSAATESVRPSN